MNRLTLASPGVAQRSTRPQVGAMPTRHEGMKSERALTGFTAHTPTTRERRVRSPQAPPQGALAQLVRALD